MRAKFVILGRVQRRKSAKPKAVVSADPPSRTVLRAPALLTWLLREFSLSLHPDKTPDRVRPLCGAEPREARAWQTGDLHVPGLCADLRQIPAGRCLRENARSWC